MEGTKKKTLGRRKIEIRKIEKKSSLLVAFSKRKKGLFRKASEISLLCGAQIAIILQSPAEKIFAFGQPSVEAVIDRLNSSPENSTMIGQGGDDGRCRYEKTAEMLEKEKRMARGLWWEEEIEGLELHELEAFLGSLEELRENVDWRLQFMELSRLVEFEEFAVPSPPLLLDGDSCVSSSSTLASHHS